MQKLIFRAPVTTASGYGVHSRQLLKALMAANRYDISVAACNWGNTSFILEHNKFMDEVYKLIAKHEIEKRENRANYDISVQVTIPNEFEKMARINIGVTAGIEVDRCSPEWLTKINEKVDLLVVPSVHSQNTIGMVGYGDPNSGQQLRLQKPLALCPEGVDTRYFNPEPLPAEAFEKYKFDADFNFLFVGLGLDKPMGEDRKNLSHLIKWFCERFKDDPNVGLVLKAGMVNGSLMDFENFSRRVQEIKKAYGGERYPRIHLIHGRLSDPELAALYKHPKVKAFVSLTHGEGFGLPIIEAAACGLPVITTAWSGQLDFLTIDGKKRFIPVDFDLGEIPGSCVWPGVMEQGSRWANPKEDDAKLKMKKVVLSYTKPKEWADELAKHIVENYAAPKMAEVFAKTVESFVQQFQENNPKNEDEAVELIRKRFRSLGAGEKTLLYTMPMSAGDVYISTAVVNGLKKKYPDHQIFFATNAQYTSILKNNPDVFKVVQWEQWMMNVPLCERIFDVVCTPNLGIQLLQSNWVKKGKGRLLGNEMAHSCDVEFGDYYIECDPVEGLPEKYIVLNPGSGKGQWEARNYLHWQEVINNLANITHLPIVQVGMPEDPEYKGVVDFRGKTNYNQLAAVVKSAAVVVGIDSVTSHMAAGFEVPQVSLYGSSYATATGPVLKKKLPMYLLDTPSRYSCDKACYKYQCSVDKDHPCVNEIEPKNVTGRVIDILGLPIEDMTAYVEHRPTISGYTHLLNPEEQGFPYLQSIKSMLGFCDEVVVVDGGSTDASLGKLRQLAAADPRLKIHEREWDWNEPGMDGMQKAFGRAMCSSDFLWQQDADEIVHEEDYEKIRKLAKRFPKDVNLLHLPVIDLWGDNQTARTDRHSWKWRFSRNDFRITHGINKDARVLDEKTGKTFAKKGQSDGCEYVDLMDYTYVPHKGFYSMELENLRQRDPAAYGVEMNRIFKELPSVFHYSWADIPRKIKNFRDFWDKCWSNLYNEEKRTKRFFPDRDWETVTEEEIQAEAEKMKLQGGEHGPALTFKLERSNPAVME